MSKAEDKAKEFLKKLVSHTTLYKGTIDELEVYEPDDVIWAYKEGYHQADNVDNDAYSKSFKIHSAKVHNYLEQHKLLDKKKKPVLTDGLLL